MSTSITRVRVRFVAPLAVAAAMIVAGAGATSANAATAKLTITPTGYYDQYYVTVGGEVAGNYPQGFDTAIRLWGEDEWFDDLLAGPFVNTWTFSNGFGREFVVSGSTLNEDWGRDEIYAGVRIYDRRTGKQVESAETNRIYGYFS